MLKVVEDEAAIRRHQRLFAKAMRTAAKETIPVKLGHPGASEKAKVAWSETLGIWFFSRKIAGSRYWNAFGVGRPAGGAGIAITCEINFPLCGIDRRTGGAFAQDRAGHVFVVHRGKLGGGRKGIGKSLFENTYRGVWEVMEDGGEETPVALIGVLHSPRFARQIAQFVRKIARIKESASARSPQAELTLEEFAIHEEMIGASYRDEEREIGAECDHGLIVRDLADALKESSHEDRERRAPGSDGDGPGGPDPSGLSDPDGDDASRYPRRGNTAPPERPEPARRSAPHPHPAPGTGERTPGEIEAAQHRNPDL